MSDSYKLAKEAFVANNAGTSVSTINIVSLAGLTSYGLYSTVARSKNGQGVSLLMDFAISVVPLFLGQTVFARTPIRFNLALAMTALIVWAVYKPPKDQPKTGHVQGVSAKSGTDGPGKRFPPRSFLSVYRAQMMLMTVIAILAVDFPIFPRSFGKCEDWGTSLMDIGVGSFVFSLGLANASSWLRNGINRQDGTLASQGDSFARTMVTSLRKTLPVLALGVVRVLMVKGVEYPVSASQLNKLINLSKLMTRCLWPALDFVTGTRNRVWSSLELFLHSCFDAVLWSCAILHDPMGRAPGAGNTHV